MLILELKLLIYPNDYVFRLTCCQTVGRCKRKGWVSQQWRFDAGETVTSRNQVLCSLYFCVFSSYFVIHLHLCSLCYIQPQGRSFKLLVNLNYYQEEVHQHTRFPTIFSISVKTSFLSSLLPIIHDTSSQE